VITRRSVLVASGGALLVKHRLGFGQPAATIRRVGWMSIGSKTSPTELYAVFKQKMHDLGWLEGNNVEYRTVYADGDVNRLDAIASELIRQSVDVIVVGNATSTRAVQRVTKTIPIVMTAVNNPVGNGFVASLAKPGGNITGMSPQGDDVLGKLIGIQHEIAPRAQRIAILLNESNPNDALYWAAAQRGCAALDLVALRIVASTPAHFGAAVGEIVRQRAQAVVVAPDAVLLNERVKLQELLQATRLPVAYASREHVVAGGLLSYGVDLPATVRKVAIYVDKILKGAKPADLPVEQPTKFNLVINLKTAKTLGITIPKDVLVRADEVIQ
jgi:putative tryptophan/tyrosine transport system substrate-binding protein